MTKRAARAKLAAALLGTPEVAHPSPPTPLFAPLAAFGGLARGVRSVVRLGTAFLGWRAATCFRATTGNRAPSPHAESRVKRAGAASGRATRWCRGAQR